MGQLDWSGIPGTDECVSIERLGDLPEHGGSHSAQLRETEEHATRLAGMTSRMREIRGWPPLQRHPTDPIQRRSSGRVNVGTSGCT